jgi:hypothetical protein
VLQGQGPTSGQHSSHSMLGLDRRGDMEFNIIKREHGGVFGNRSTDQGG